MITLPPVPAPPAGAITTAPAGAITRRSALGLTTGAVSTACAIATLLCAPRRGSASSHFWDTRPAAQWTPEEIVQLTANSPWAKTVTAQYRAAMDDLRPQPEPEPGRGEQKVGECGLGPCGSIMPGKVAVIWESALPIREALHPVIPPEFNGHYVISIRGLEGEQTSERLKAGADLSAKGKPPLQPGLVGFRNGTWIFGFSRDQLPLDTGDKDVLFTVRVGATLSATLLRAAFNPKEMIYRGALAL
jgi:hypothetical protein